MTSASSPHFICGMSRTGITALTRALNSHPDVATFGQSRFWGRHWVEPAHDGRYSPEQLDGLHRTLRGFTWTGTIGEGPGTLDMDLDAFRELLDRGVAAAGPGCTPAQLFSALADALRARQGATYVFEKTPHHLLCADRILEHLPDAHFVVIRAPAALFLRMHKSQPDLRYHPAVAGWVWRAFDRAHRDLVARRPDRVVTVALDELIADPDRALAPVQEHFSLTPRSLRAPVDAAPDLPPPASLDAAEELAAALVDRGSAAWPALSPSTLGAVARSGMSLPRYVGGAALDFQQDHSGSLREYLARWLR